MAAGTAEDEVQRAGARAGAAAFSVGGHPLGECLLRLPACLPAALQSPGTITNDTQLATQAHWYLLTRF
jgi:hypothetical protein